MKEDKKRKIELPKKITVVDGQTFFDEKDNILKTDTGIPIVEIENVMQPLTPPHKGKPTA